MPSDVIVTVVDPKGRKHTVIGWAADLIVLALLHAETLNAAAAGQAVADFGPTSGMSLKLNRELGRTKRN